MQMIQSALSIVVITEIKKKLKDTNELMDFVMIYNGLSQTNGSRCGVAVLIDKDVAKSN